MVTALFLVVSIVLGIGPTLLMKQAFAAPDTVPGLDGFPPAASSVPRGMSGPLGGVPLPTGPRPTGAAGRASADAMDAWLAYVVHLGPSFRRLAGLAAGVQTADRNEASAALAALVAMRTWAGEELAYHRSNPPHACYATAHGKVAQLVQLLWSVTDDAVRAVNNGDAAAHVRVAMKASEIERTFGDASVEQLFLAAGDACLGFQRPTS